MIIGLPSSISNLAVFGSYGRGDFDVISDLDVLVVVKDGSGTTPESAVAEAIAPLLPKKPSISFYGERRLRQMFREGHLFAWHLYLESYSIAGFTSLRDSFGPPSPYSTAIADIGGLVEILNEVEGQIRRAPHNSIFEMGILYVCARNIAMSASWHLAEGPDFGRHSPYSLPGLSFPIEKAEYEQTMQCRMASTRGEVAPKRVTPHLAIAIASALGPWTSSVVNTLRRQQ